MPNRFCFTGEQYDPITSQYYLRARFYNPAIGRFLNEDIYYGDGLNLYAYCHNNPVGYVDPSGHDACPLAVQKYKEKGYSDEDAVIMANYEKLREEQGVDAAERYLQEQAKGSSGKKSSGLPDWLKKLFDAGNDFNKANRPNYPYNEVEVYGDRKNYVVDSYVPGKEIISRKFTQLANVKVSTGIGYLNELKTKYPSGAIITDSPFNPKVLRGQELTGQLILEIPVQNKPIPQRVLDYANANDIVIRDVERNVYN